MFPIRDHNPSERTPYVVYALMALNILIFLTYWGDLDQPFRVAGFFNQWAMTPEMIADGRMTHTLLTYMFLHGGLMHLAGNMLFLWIFGDNLEDQLGHLGFLLFYLATGIGAGLLQMLADPSSTVPVVGASGAIAGVMGGYLLLFPKAKVDILLIIIIFFRIFPVPAWLMLAVWFGLQLFNGVAQSSAEAGVAYWAHAGGFIIGLILMVPLWLRRGATDHWERTDGHPDHPDAQYGPLSNSSIPKVRRRK